MHHWCKLVVLALSLSLLNLDMGSVFAAQAVANPPNKQEQPQQEPQMRFDIIRLSSTACEPLCPEWISAEGQIKADTASKLNALLKNPAYRTLPILINSGGGSIKSALDMGKLIRKYRMTAAVGKTIIFGCVETDRIADKCKVDNITKAYNGLAMPIEAYCASACPLMLLGGVVRVVDTYSFIGLHEPRAETQPYVDHYIISYSMINGHKHFISKEFVKRTYLAKKEIVGVTPVLRRALVPYLKEMGGAPDIIAEMDKAAPKDMNWIKAGTGERERLGLTSNGGSRYTTSFDMLTSPRTCKSSEVRPVNCVLVKEKGPQLVRPTNGQCFILSGCS